MDTKPTIVFLFTGQARTSPFALNKLEKSNCIMDSYNTFLFTDLFKKTYNYKIYISTDDVHLENTINYFKEENIGNIHLFDTNFFQKPINSEIEDVSYYLNNYNNKDWDYHCKENNAIYPYDIYENSIYQHYKILDCYNMFENDVSNIINLKYIVRIRMDVIIQEDFMNLIDFIENNNNVLYCIKWDFFSLGKPDIMKYYCNGLNNNYGNIYNYKERFPSFWHNYNDVPKRRWTFAPERQLFELLFQYCDDNNIDINTGIQNTNFCEIIRP